jgi:hypothetical protein
MVSLSCYVYGRKWSRLILAHRVSPLNVGPTIIAAASKLPGNELGHSHGFQVMWDTCIIPALSKGPE